jgi:hypothetical protein
MENWKLNPGVKNPNKLSIGQELTVIKQRIIPAEKATMLNIVNNVEKKLVVGDWLAAKVGDELQQQEGVRTLEKSSTLLKFNETSSLKILEFSQVYLQSRNTSLTGTDSSTIEIIAGDAELKWEPINVKKSEIEIISGQTKLTPSNTNGKVTSLRTGLAENGNSVISVYDGTSNVESAGTEVVVPNGMGVSVKQGEKPPKPKPLLKKPTLITQDSKTFNYTNPFIKWKPVNQAYQYLIEICLDKNCNRVIAQMKTENQYFQINNIHERGNYYWRVAGISQDDIVGFKSNTNQIVFSTNKADNQGPKVAINIIGKQSTINDKIVTSAQSNIEIISIDNQSGLDTVEYKWDQENWSSYDDKSSAFKAKIGSLTLKAKDQLGNESQKTYWIKVL